MTTASRQLQRRDKDGLTLQQRNTLQALAQEEDWRKACASVGVLPATLQKWLQTDEKFGARYDQLLGPALDIAQSIIETSALKAAGMYEEAMDAVRTVTRDVTCPECSHRFTAFQTVPDWSNRLRAGDTILKVSNILIERKRIDQTITTLNFEETMALAQIRYAQRKGQDNVVSPGMMDVLRRKGVVDEAPTVEVLDDSDDGVQP